MEADGVISGLLVLVVSLSFWVYSEHRGHDRMRVQRDAVQARLDAVVVDRDGWREAAQRGLVQVELRRDLMQLASRIAESVVAKT